MRAENIATAPDEPATASLGSLEPLLDAVPTGMLAVDAQGKIRLVNSELLQRTGFTREQLLDQPLGQLIEAPSGDNAPSALNGNGGTVSAEPAKGSQRHWLRHANGERSAVMVKRTPWQGHAAGWTIVTVSHSDDRQHANNELQSLIESAPMGIVVADAAGSISLINARGAAMFGYTMAELTGHPLEVLLPERHRDQHEQHRAGYAAHPTARFMGVGRDLTALHRDGSEFPVEIGLNVYNDGSGPKVVATINDITARKQAEQALLQANADLDEFTYVASHDLKSPVRGIGSLLEWIEEDLGDDIADEVKHNLDRARIRVERMQQLIDDLLSYARAGRAQDVFDHVDLRALIDEIIETLDVPATFSVSADLLDQAVFTSKTPLATVLRNLVSNAVKHHDRQHGEVRIRQFRRGAFLVFEVSDDGPGIPSAAHARICKLFQTLSHDSKGPRSGVGLAVCKRLIQASGGVLEIDSCEQQRGSVFRFTWPLVKRRDLHGSD